MRLQRQAVQQMALGSGRQSQLSQGSKRSESEMLLQLACWMAETGQGARAEVSGARPPFQALFVHEAWAHVWRSTA